MQVLSAPHSLWFSLVFARSKRQAAAMGWEHGASKDRGKEDTMQVPSQAPPHEQGKTGQVVKQVADYKAAPCILPRGRVLL